MEEEYNKDIEDEMEELEEEIKEDTKVTPTRKPKSKVAGKEPKPTERYTAFYQEARIGIMDTVTNEIVVEGLNDVASAGLEAFKLNILDKIGTASGA